MNLITAFNNLMEQFLMDLQKVFPTESYIVNFYTAFLLVKKTNPRQISQNYMEYVGPYKNQINNCQTEFFLKFDKDNNFGITDEFISNGLKLKHLWLLPTTTDNTKACIIAYLQKLLKLGEKITN